MNFDYNEVFSCRKILELLLLKFGVIVDIRKIIFYLYKQLVLKNVFFFSEEYIKMFLNSKRFGKLFLGGK